MHKTEANTVLPYRKAPCEKPLENYRILWKFPNWDDLMVQKNAQNKSHIDVITRGRIFIVFVSWHFRGTQWIPGDLEVAAAFSRALAGLKSELNG
jgi:hypothetical protein